MKRLAVLVIGLVFLFTTSAFAQQAAPAPAPSGGGASAGGIIAVILANVVAFFLMRAVGKNLDK